MGLVLDCILDGHGECGIVLASFVSADLRSPVFDVLGPVFIPGIFFWGGSPQMTAKLCALNIFFQPGNELEIYHGNILLTDNEHRKLFVIKQSKGCRFMPKMYQNAFGGLEELMHTPSRNGEPTYKGRREEEGGHKPFLTTPRGTGERGRKGGEGNFPPKSKVSRINTGWGPRPAGK